MIDRKVFTLRTTEELINKIAYLADTNKRSMNAQMEFMLEECIKDYEKQHGPVKIKE